MGWDTKKILTTYLFLGALATSSWAQGRVFMDAEGNAGAGQPTTGHTMITVNPGTTRTIEVWMVDDEPGGTLLTGYQLVFQCPAITADPGIVEYVDNNPGMGGGDSIFINSTRADWVFRNSIAVNPNFIFKETCTDLNRFGTIHNTAVPLDDKDVHEDFGSAPAYLTQFDLAISEDACGLHTVFFNTAKTGEVPFSALFAPTGLQWFADDTQTPVLYQHLDIVVDACTGCDVDENGIRDDGCVWCQCTDLCGNDTTQIDIVFGDMGGQFGDCTPDGVTDSHDRFHALNCFANVDVSGPPGLYPCEIDPPNALNVDAGGAFGSCSPDGVCDGNDAFHALSAFAGTSSCSCPLDPGPSVDRQRPTKHR